MKEVYDVHPFYYTLIYGKIILNKEPSGNRNYNNFLRPEKINKVICKREKVVQCLRKKMWNGF